MTIEIPAIRRAVLALAVALLSAGCTTSDGLLAPDEGRVRFLLSADDGPVADGPIAVGAIPESPGTPGAEPAHDDDDDDEEPDHDRPRGFFESANVTFTSILARNIDGVLLNVDMDLPVTVDIMAMEGRRSVELPDGDLPTGTYDQVVVVMSQVQGITHDGTTITIEPPGGGWTAVVPLCPFLVDGGGTTTVSLTLMIRHAFQWRGNRHHFEPRFRCDDEEPVE